MQSQHCCHAASASKQTPAEALFIDGDQWNPRGICITSHHAAGMQYAPPHHTTLSTACALHSAILSGYNDTCMQNNATRLTFRTLRLVPISSPLYTPVAQSTFGPEMRLKQPETQQKLSEKCADTLRKMRRFRFWLQLHFPAVPVGNSIKVVAAFPTVYARRDVLTCSLVSTSASLSRVR